MILKHSKASSIFKRNTCFHQSHNAVVKMMSVKINSPVFDIKMNLVLLGRGGATLGQGGANAPPDLRLAPPLVGQALSIA